MWWKYDLVKFLQSNKENIYTFFTLHHPKPYGPAHEHGEFLFLLMRRFLIFLLIKSHNILNSTGFLLGIIWE